MTDIQIYIVKIHLCRDCGHLPGVPTLRSHGQHLFSQSVYCRHLCRVNSGGWCPLAASTRSSAYNGAMAARGGAVPFGFDGMS